MGNDTKPKEVVISKGGGQAVGIPTTEQNELEK